MNIAVRDDVYNRDGRARAAVKTVITHLANDRKKKITIAVPTIFYYHALFNYSFLFLEECFTG